MDFLETAPYALRLDVLEKSSPAALLTAWKLKLITAEDYGIILEKVAKFSLPKTQKMMCDGERWYKTAVKQHDSLSEVLKRGHWWAQHADITLLHNATCNDIIAKKICNVLNEMRHTPRPKWLEKHYKDGGNYPFIRYPIGSFSRFYDSFAACAGEYFQRVNAVFFRSDEFRIYFNKKGRVNSVLLNGKMVEIPYGMTLTVCIMRDETYHMTLMIDNFPRVSVFPDGRALFFGQSSLRVLDFMQCWDADAFTAAEIIGVACDNCIWCGRELTDSTSVANSAGPVCRKYNDTLKLVMAGTVNRSGPILNATLIPQARRTIQLPTGEEAELSEALMKASPVLSVFMEEEGFDAADQKALVLQSMSGIKASALADLTRVIETGWFPVDQDRLQDAMLASHVLLLKDDILCRIFADRWLWYSNEYSLGRDVRSRVVAVDATTRAISMVLRRVNELVIAPEKVKRKRKKPANSDETVKRQAVV